MSSGGEDVQFEDVDDLERLYDGVEETENIEEAIEDNTGENGENEQGNEDEDESQKKVVKPKRVVRNPQPKLNDQTLKGPKGIGVLSKYFENVQFKGKGYEEEDLNVLLKTYEYWCHRMFPKFPFEDCIEKLEKLGAKKTVQTYLKRIRMNITFDEEPDKMDSDNEEIAMPVEENVFDQLTKRAEPVVNEEMLERMRLNREKAEKIKQERLQRIRAKVSNNIGESQILQHRGTVNRDQTSLNDIENNSLPPSYTQESRKSIDSDKEEFEKMDTNATQTPHKKVSRKKRVFESDVEEIEEDDQDVENIDDMLDEINNSKQKNTVESDGNSLSPKTQQPKRTILDSDSDTEATSLEQLSDNIGNANEDSNLFPSQTQKLRRKTVIDSDSEDSEEMDTNVTSKSPPKKISRKNRVLDSDDEDIEMNNQQNVDKISKPNENNVTEKNTFESDESENSSSLPLETLKSRKSKIPDSDDEEYEMISQQLHKKKRVIDSDNEETEENNQQVAENVEKETTMNGTYESETQSSNLLSSNIKESRSTRIADSECEEILKNNALSDEGEKDEDE